MSLTTLILIQASVSLGFLLLLQWVWLWRAKRREQRAAKHLIDKLQQGKAERAAFLDAFLQTGLNWQDSREETVQVLQKAERKFLKEGLDLYLSRDTDALIELDTKLYELLEQYQFLTPSSSVTEPETVPMAAMVDESLQLQKDKKRLTLELHQALRVLNDLFIEHSAMFGDMSRPERDLSVAEIEQQLALMHGAKAPSAPTTASSHQAVLSTLSAPVPAADWQQSDPFSGYDEQGAALAADQPELAADLDLNESEDERLAREWAQQLETPVTESAESALDLNESDDERLAREWAQQLEAPVAESAESALDLNESDDERLAREWAQQLEAPVTESAESSALDLNESDDERLAREWAQQLEAPVTESAESALDLNESDDERLAREWAQQLEAPVTEPAESSALDLNESDDERLAREWAQQLEASIEQPVKPGLQRPELDEDETLFSEDQLSSLFAELDDAPVTTKPEQKNSKKA